MYKSITLTVKGSYIGNQFTDGGTVVYPAVANFLNESYAKLVWMSLPRDMGNTWEVDLLYEVNNDEVENKLKTTRDSDNISDCNENHYEIKDDIKNNLDSPNIPYEQKIVTNTSSQSQMDKAVTLTNFKNGQVIIATMGKVVVHGKTIPRHGIYIKVTLKDDDWKSNSQIITGETGDFTYTLKRIGRNTSYKIQFYSDTIIDERGNVLLEEGAIPDAEVTAEGGAGFLGL